MRKVTSAGTTLFFYDAAGHLLEERSLASTPNPTRDYVWIEDEPVGAVDLGVAAPVYSWVHTDYLGMPMAVTSTPAAGSAQTIWRGSYAPFGIATETLDPDGDGQQYSVKIRFPG